jgi:hypothetical protein
LVKEVKDQLALQNSTASNQTNMTEPAVVTAIREDDLNREDKEVNAPCRDKLKNKAKLAKAKIDDDQY